MCCDMYRVGQTKTIYFRFVVWSSDVLIGELIIIAELASILIALKGTLPCPDNEGVWVEQVCSYTHILLTLYGGKQFHAPIYTRGKNFRSWVRQRRCGGFGGEKTLLSLPTFDHPPAVVPQLFHVCLPDRSTASYSPCTASSSSCNVCPVSAPSHILPHALLTCKLTTTQADPYNDREVLYTCYCSIHRQFSPSASPFISYRLDSVISVSISVGFFRLSQKAFGLTWRFVSLSTSICN
jgi:hypothetical protein